MGEGRVIYFSGEIAGKRLSDFNKYDNSLKTLKERSEFVQELLHDGEFIHEFFATYLSRYYKVSPKQDGYLAEENVVFKLLEGLGSYLIDSQDVASYRKVQYRFWRDEKDFRRFKESENINASALATGTSDDVEVIDMFVDKKNDKNQKVVGNTTINRKDIKEIFEIGALQDAINYMKSPNGLKAMKEHCQMRVQKGVKRDGTPINESDLEKLKYIAKNTDRYINRYVKTLRDSQVIIKDAIKRPIRIMNALKDEGASDKLEAFDFMEKKDVEALLPFISSQDLMTDMGVLAYDLNLIIDRTKLSPREQEVVKAFRIGYSDKEIIQELGIKKQNLNTYIGRISEKIVKTYGNQVSEYRDRIRQKKIK